MGTIFIGDTGEQFITAEWAPDPKIIEQQLLKFSVDSENMFEPLTAAREAFVYDTSLHFETESDPYGRAWTPLEEKYLRRREREGNPGNILHVSGKLEQAATDTGNWLITESDIIFKVDGLPFYGPYHQSGTMDPAKQGIVHKLRSGQEISRAEAGIDISPSTKGRGFDLPQRMFIGADEPTLAEVEDIFLKWLDGLIRMDFPPFSGGSGFGGITSSGKLILRSDSGQFLGSIGP